MQISILLALYNSKPFIKRCLRSVVSQTFTDYEVVLVDDASTDSGLQIAEQFLKKHQVTFQSIKHQQNEYLATTRNTGINAAKGKYIMFMDQDDELAHNTVFTQFYEAIERTQTDFVCANFYAVYEGGRQKTTYIKGIDEDKLLQNDGVLTALCKTEISVSAWNKLIRRAFLLENNLFFQQGLLHEDELWAFQMCLIAKKCYCLSDCLYDYHKDNDFSITKNITEKTFSDKLFILQQQLRIMKEKQLINNENTEVFIYHFKRLMNESFRPKLIQNKKLWMNNYEKISMLYRQSELWQYKKLFRFPTHIAYFIRKEKYKNRRNDGNKQYRKFLRKLDKYNWEGEV